MEGDVITLQDLFVLPRRGRGQRAAVIGQLEPTGLRPTFLDKFERKGIPLPAFMRTGAAAGAAELRVAAR